MSSESQTYDKKPELLEVWAVFHHNELYFCFKSIEDAEAWRNSRRKPQNYTIKHMREVSNAIE